MKNFVGYDMLKWNNVKGGMFVFCVRLAGMMIEIDNRYSYIEEYCRDFIVSDCMADFRVASCDDENRRLVANAGYPLSMPEAECIIVYRKICMTAPAYNSFLFHSAVVSAPGCCVAFSAHRGVGKTTHAVLWRERFGGKARIINGDKPLIRCGNGVSVAYGTPWCGKERLGYNSSAKLDAVCFIEQSRINKIRRIDDGEFAARLAEQVIYPSDWALRNRFADLAAGMIKTLPAYVLSCDISFAAVDTAYMKITGDLSARKTVTTYNSNRQQ